MKNLASFLLGTLLTLFAVYVYTSTQSEEIKTYTPTFISNEETGASARIMEADVIYFDTDGDGDEENIILYSCYLCNAPPREIAIIDDGELVFFYEGGDLKFIPTKPGAFTIDEANVPRDGRRIETSYIYNKSTSIYELNTD
jgi:hypothetical protein